MYSILCSTINFFVSQIKCIIIEIQVKCSKVWKPAQILHGLK